MLKNKVPNHLAIILDGNGRWAKSKGLVRSIGHKVGANIAKDIISYVFDKDVKVLSLFCFSTENWKRSEAEINYLMSIPITYFSKYEENLIQLYSIVLYCATAYSAFVTFFAPFIIDLIYGQEYYPAINVLRVLVWYTLFSYFGGAKDVWILAEGKQKYLLWLNLFGAMANVLLNLLLIPVWGVIGAALASLVTQAFTNVAMCYVIKPLRANTFLFFKALNPLAFYRALKSMVGK